MGKRALITGITGQDGSYLAEYLLDPAQNADGLIARRGRGLEKPDISGTVVQQQQVGERATDIDAKTAGHDASLHRRGPYQLKWVRARRRHDRQEGSAGQLFPVPYVRFTPLVVAPSWRTEWIARSCVT